MARLGIFTCIVFTIVINLSNSQVPPRLSIPGAIPLPPQSKTVLRQRLQQLDPNPPLRRRLPQNAIPIPLRDSVRPVVEELEEEPQQNTFDDEVARLGISALQTAVQQAEEEPVDRQLAFRPERPVPVLRQDVRDGPRPLPVQAKSLPLLRPDNSRPVIRQELKQEIAFARPAPSRQEFREEAPVQQHVRRPAPQPQVTRQQAPQPARHAPARIIAPRPTSQYLDQDEPVRGRKPPVQILRKYRTDNADGSITWGYENEDGTFKEENIGIDCITRGKYGYVDPDGVRREYSYETGGRCEDPEELAEVPPQQAAPKGKKPNYRLPVQYAN